MNYWLMKSEPTVYSMDDLKKDKMTFWDGVRNFQARNFMRDSMALGDPILFYHSNAEPSGVAGIARVNKPAMPESADPRWCGVTVEFIKKFKHFVSLEELKKTQQLAGMMVIRRGSRLSVQPVEPKHFECVCDMGKA